MMRPIAATLCLSMIALSSPSYATETPTPTPTVTPDTEDGGGFNTSGTLNNGGNGDDGGSSSSPQASAGEDPSVLPPGHWEISSPCDAMSNTGCQDFVGVECPEGEQAVLWSYIRDSDGGVEMATAGCPSDPPETDETPTVDIPGEVLTAFKNVALPRSAINVQPPGGQTLVNFKTILSTQAERHQIPVHLGKVDLDIVLEVWPSGFLWKHGDDTTQSSTVPGTMWTEGADVDAADFITHVYTTILKEASVSVDTTWSAQFKVAGTPNWRPVNGTVTIEGEPVGLTVREATPELVTEPN